MEQVVKKGEFVLELPEFVIERGGVSRVTKFMDHLNKPISSVTAKDKKGITTEYCQNGITGNIEFSANYDFHVKCHASYLRTNQADCSTLNFHVKVILCTDSSNVILASESALIPGNHDHSVSGIQMKIPRSTIPKLDTNSKLRVVLNVDAVEHPKPPFLRRFQNGEDSDLQLICEDQIFRVHANVLKTVSHVFRTMLEVPMKEAATGQIVIKDLNADTVKNMVDYIYHGCMNAGSDAQVIERLYAAEKYELDSFKTACLERMVTSMSNENITSFLEMSVRVNAGNEFIKQMVDYCMDRKKELRKREDFLACFRANPSVFLEN